MAFDHDMSSNKETNQITRIVKKADILALKKEATEFPKWLSKLITPSEFRSGADELYSRMEKSKKDRSALVTKNYLVTRTSWPWQESKNFARDVGAIPYAGYLEYFTIKHYRKQLLAVSDAGAWLRTELNEKLGSHGRAMIRVARNEDGKPVNRLINEWSFPDGIATRIVNTKTFQDGLIITDVLTEKAKSSVVEETKITVQRLIQKIESMPIARVDPLKGSPINDGVAHAIGKLVDVSASVLREAI
jgi:hypothetical protein